MFNFPETVKSNNLNIFLSNLQCVLSDIRKNIYDEAGLLQNQDIFKVFQDQVLEKHKIVDLTVFIQLSFVIIDMALDSSSQIENYQLVANFLLNNIYQSNFQNILESFNFFFNDQHISQKIYKYYKQFNLQFQNINIFNLIIFQKIQSKIQKSEQSTETMLNLLNVFITRANIKNIYYDYFIYLSFQFENIKVFSKMNPRNSIKIINNFLFQKDRLIQNIIINLIFITKQLLDQNVNKNMDQVQSILYFLIQLDNHSPTLMNKVYSNVQFQQSMKETKLHNMIQQTQNTTYLSQIEIQNNQSLNILDKCKLQNHIKTYDIIKVLSNSCLDQILNNQSNKTFLQVLIKNSVNMHRNKKEQKRISHNQMNDSQTKNIQLSIMILVLIRNDYQELKHSLLFEYEDLFVNYFIEQETLLIINYYFKMAFQQNEINEILFQNLESYNIILRKNKCYQPLLQINKIIIKFIIRMTVKDSQQVVNKHLLNVSIKNLILLQKMDKYQYVQISVFGLSKLYDELFKQNYKLNGYLIDLILTLFTLNQKSFTVFSQKIFSQIFNAIDASDQQNALENEDQTKLANYLSKELKLQENKKQEDESLQDLFVQFYDLFINKKYFEQKNVNQLLQSLLKQQLDQEYISINIQQCCKILEQQFLDFHFDKHYIQNLREQLPAQSDCSLDQKVRQQLIENQSNLKVLLMIYDSKENQFIGELILIIIANLVSYVFNSEEKQKNKVCQIFTLLADRMYQLGLFKQNIKEIAKVMSLFKNSSVEQILILFLNYMTQFNILNSQIQKIDIEQSNNYNLNLVRILIDEIEHIENQYYYISQIFKI